MRLDDQRASGNVEDRRGRRMGGGAVLGGGLGVVILAVIAMALGMDPRTVLEVAQQIEGPPAEEAAAPDGPRPDDDLAEASRRMLGSTEDVWSAYFAKAGEAYQPPVLVLFDGRTDAGACGVGQAATGPFYCPPDRKLYVDLAFFRELDQRFGAPGDFAQAYVLAHEVGHHLQTLMGTAERVTAARRRAGEAEANRLSVRMELQADCYAGVWAHHARERLEPGDLEEGMTAAAAVGDDTLQRRSGGAVTPDAFTHGTSDQRMRWFRAGFTGGAIEACDTFSVAEASL